MATVAVLYSAACSCSVKHCHLALNKRHTHIHSKQLCLLARVLMLLTYSRTQHACTALAHETQWQHNPSTLTHTTLVATHNVLL
jgi:hypothetical protein